MNPDDKQRVLVVGGGLNGMLNALAAGLAPDAHPTTGVDLTRPYGGIPRGMTPPAAPEPRSGGRRETRQQIHAGKRLIFRSEGMQHGKTAPIVRAQPKRPAGMTAKDWKRARRVARILAQASEMDDTSYKVETDETNET